MLINLQMYCLFLFSFLYLISSFLPLWLDNIVNIAMAGVAQWIEHQPANERVASWIPCQGTCLGCRPGPQLWAHERQANTDVSLPHFLLSLHSL